MSKKLKITLGALLLIAGFLVVRMGLYFKNSVETANSIKAPAVLSAQDENPLLKDSDSDGVADIDESYYGTDAFKADTDGDGYLDGEEIVSFNNPTDPDDNHGLAPNQNVTQTLTDRFIGGIYSRDLLPQEGQNPKYEENINLLALAAIDEAGEALTPALGNSSLLIGTDSKEAQEQYLKDVAALLDGPFLTAFLDQTYRLSEATNLLVAGQNESAFEAFRQHAATFTFAYTRLLAVNAPPKWLPLHRQLLITFQKIATDYVSLTKIYTDPIMAMAALSDLATNFALIQSSLIEELKKIVAEEQLQLPDSRLFSVLGLLGGASKLAP